MKTLKLVALSLALCAGAITANTNEVLLLKVLGGGLEIAARSSKDGVKFALDMPSPKKPELLNVRFLGTGFSVSRHNNSLLVAGICAAALTLPKAITKVKEWYNNPKFDFTKKENYRPVLKAGASLGLLSAGLVFAQSNA